MSKIKSFFQIPFTDKLVILEAFFLLGLARAAVLSLPFRWLAYFLGEKQNSVVDKHQTEDPPPPKARHISWAIRLMSHHTPWKSNCLAKAVAGRFMLKRRNIPGTIYFGMAKATEGELEAHAWLKSGNRVLTGNTNLEQYKIVAIFQSTN